jgi:phytoene/squalene synthetase
MGFTGADVMSREEFEQLTVDQRREVYLAATLLGLEEARTTVEAYLAANRRADGKGNDPERQAPCST